MQIGEILHNTKCFWIAFDKSYPSFIPILFFANESNVQNASLEALSHICFIISFQFYKLKNFCTTQNVFGKHLTNLALVSYLENKIN
jgi:hypothetical protein